jgi:hypothetical protein
MTNRTTAYGFKQASWVWKSTEIGDVLSHTCHPHYNIDLEQHKTPQQLVALMLHLSDKNCITKDDLTIVLSRFVEKLYPKEQPRG